MECLTSAFVALLGVVLSAETFRQIDMKYEIQKM